MNSFFNTRENVVATPSPKMLEVGKQHLTIEMVQDVIRDTAMSIVQKPINDGETKEWIANGLALFHASLKKTLSPHSDESTAIAIACKFALREMRARYFENQSNNQSKKKTTHVDAGIRSKARRVVRVIS